MGRLYLKFSGLEYDIKIERRVTVVKGASSTGKSTFVRKLEEVLSSKHKTGISFINETSLDVVVFRPSTDWHEMLLNNNNMLVVVDDDVDYIYTEKFQKLFVSSHNYILIFSRSAMFRALPYSIMSVYEMRTHNRVTKLYRLYEKSVTEHTGVMITEDSNSGYQMMSEIFEDVLSANGNSNVTKIVTEVVKTHPFIIVLVDGAAFGGFIEELMTVQMLHFGITILAPESFEYVLLNTSLFKEHIYDMISNASYYCKDITYESYFTRLLINLCKYTYGVNYTKSQLPKLFKNKKYYKEVVDLINKNTVKYNF